MNREQAEAYGKRIGCRYYVVNDRGGLYGGFRKLEDAEKCRDENIERFRNDPWNKDVKVYIEERRFCGNHVHV